MISVTETAAQEVKRIIQDQGLAEEVYLRLGVKGGGCSGISYTIGFADSPDDGDEVHEEHGVRVLVDPKSALFMDGLELGYQKSLMERGFVFNNPNAERSCSCGKSFS